MRKDISSPVTNSFVKKIITIDTDIIIKKYHEELSIDVKNYFTNINEVIIYECKETGYRFYYPFTIFGDNIFYEQLQKNEGYYPQWKWENQTALDSIKSTDSVLDIGCGEGNFLKELKKRGVNNLYGIDTNANTIEYQDIENIHILNNFIEDMCHQYSSKFNVITCFQVLEHIVDINGFINSCLKCLKPNGKLIIAVPNNDPYLYKHDIHHTLNLPPHHSGLWCRKSLKNIATFFNMKLVALETQPIGEQIGYYTIVQKQNIIKKMPFIKFLFNLNYLDKIYNKLFYLRRDKIEGHTIIAVYQKK